MSPSTFLNGGVAILAVAASALVPASAAAQSVRTEPGPWRYAATLYAYLPKVDGLLGVPMGSSSPSFNVDASSLVDDLQFTVMGSFDAHNGRWGVFTDLLYLDVSGSESKTRNFTIGNAGLPSTATADASLDLKGVVWTLAGEYRLVSGPEWTLDVLAGARLFDVKPTLGWSLYGDLGPVSVPGRSGSNEQRASNWDAIIGLKGGYRFGANREWLVPMYLDVGTGESDLTWQGAVGLGYSFKWGELVAMWRYLDYDLPSGESISEMSFNGPMIGATFRW
jgi:hypothetical protein